MGQAAGKDVMVCSRDDCMAEFTDLKAKECRHHGEFAVLRRIPGVRSRETFLFYWCCGSTKKSSPGCMLTPHLLPAEVTGIGMTDWRNTVMNTMNGGKGTIQGTVKAGSTINGSKKKRKTDEDNDDHGGTANSAPSIKLPMRLALDPNTAFSGMQEAAKAMGRNRMQSVRSRVQSTAGGMRSRAASPAAGEPEPAGFEESLRPPPTSASAPAESILAPVTESQTSAARDRAKTMAAGSSSQLSVRKRSATMDHSLEPEDEFGGFGSSVENLTEDSYGFKDDDTERDFVLFLDPHEQQVDLTISSFIGVTLVDPAKITPRTGPIVSEVAEDSVAADKLQSEDKLFMVGPIRVLGMSAEEVQPILDEVKLDTLVTVARSNNQEKV